MRTMYDNANKTTSMKITELIWLDNVIGKIESKHHCPPTDAIRSLYQQAKGQKDETEDISVERMFIGHLGRQKPGVTEQVFFIHKRTNKALILSARDMDEKERKSYARK